MNNHRKLNIKVKHVGICETTVSTLLPVKTITIAFIFIVVSLGSGFYARYWYAQFRTNESKSHSIVELNGTIIHLDEVLTMSVRMAAATGDQQWEERYRSVESKLDAAIKESMNLTSKNLINKAYEHINIANIKLVAMENKAFDLVRQGNLEGATKLLYSQEYEKQKRIYSQNREQAIGALAKYMKAKIDTRERSIGMALGATMFVSFVVLLIVFGNIVITQMSKHSKAEREREKLLLNMDARIKKFRCMYSVATSIKKRKTIESVFHDVIELIPPAWHYPEITRAKICFDGASYVSQPFEQTQWKQTSDIVINGRQRGSIEVYYLKECPMLDEGPFLDEERHLINGLSQALSEAAERKKAEQDLKKAATYLNAMSNTMIVLNIQKQVIEFNRAAMELLGYSQGEMNGLTFEKIFPKKEHEKHYIEMKDAAETEPARTFETTVLTRSKKEIPVQFSYSKMKDVKGIASFLGICSDITARKKAEKDLEQAHLELVESSRMAGMAEVASDVLHNVGNVLNSINVSTTVIREKVINSEITNLEKVASIINEYTDDLGTFFTEHPKGKHIPVYLSEVSKCMQDEQTDIMSRLQVLADNVQHIKDIINMQQSYSKVTGFEVQTSLSKLVEDAIQINSAGLERHEVQLIREFEELGDVEIDKQKILQILVNLISNAKYAVSGNDKEEKLLTIRIYKHGEDHLRIEVADKGVGILKDNLTKIFNHGFTTKKHGHGFGLHSGALAAKEMGGSLAVHSDGVGQGATFTLELPFKPVEVRE